VSDALRAIEWLDPGMTNMAAASKLLAPYDARLMLSHERTDQ
jgi:hypothetical protein